MPAASPWTREFLLAGQSSLLLRTARAGIDVGLRGGPVPFPGRLPEALGLHREQVRLTAWTAVADAEDPNWER